jgi:hypothetical protein
MVADSYYNYRNRVWIFNISRNNGNHGTIVADQKLQQANDCSKPFFRIMPIQKRNPYDFTFDETVIDRGRRFTQHYSSHDIHWNICKNILDTENNFHASLQNILYILMLVLVEPYVYPIGRV